MKVLNVIQCTNLGGTERGSLQFLLGLQSKGHSCQVVSLNPLGQFAPVLQSHDIPAEGLPYRGKWGLLSHPLLRRTLRSIRADALMMSGHNLLAIAACRNLWEGRRVLTIHYHHKGEKPAWQWNLIYRLARKTFTAITFNSDFIRHEAESICPPISAISKTVRYPITIPSLPTEEEKQQARNLLGIPKTVKVIGNASWLIRRKRYDIFLKVAARVSRQYPQTIFLVAGDGPYRPELKEMAEQLGISNRVYWLGWQTDMRPFYLSLDALLFNSDWDALPMVALEAMSYGVPVVASILNGGLNEVLFDGHNGYLFSTHDIEALTHSLKAAMDGNMEIGMAGRQSIKEHCAFEKYVLEMEQLLMLGGSKQ